MAADTPEQAKQELRRRLKRPKLCDHGYPAIPDPRGCAIHWTRHPGYVKPEAKEPMPPKDVRQVTCEKCFLPAQIGAPPLVRLAGAPDEAAKYEHLVCPSDTAAAAAPPRDRRRLFRRRLTASIRSHLRKMLRIKTARRQRIRVLRVETARTERLLAAKEQAA